eukprot:1192338-Prorocentrum_minimum.AAC.1
MDGTDLMNIDVRFEVGSGPIRTVPSSEIVLRPIRTVQSSEILIRSDPNRSIERDRFEARSEPFNRARSDLSSRDVERRIAAFERSATDVVLGSWGPDQIRSDQIPGPAAIRGEARAY